jgi:alpha-L-rhamnosidase
MDALAPRFSWVPPQPGPGGRVLPMDAQSAAEVVVNCTDGTQWSSGKVPGSTPALTPTEPLPLVSDQACVATVRVWTGPTAAAVESDPAAFVTGLFHQSDWGQARWIGGANLLRKDVVVTSTPARVSIFVGACQYYKLTLDGIPVGNHQLDVVWTRFRTNRSYAAYNLDPKLMAPGKHTLGLQVGEGFCGESAGKAGNHTRSALLRMVLHGPPSSDSAVVVTDSTWAGAWGPIEWDSTYFGESVDSRFSQPGWDTPTFVPSPQSRPWLPAVDQGLAINGPTLSSQLQPAIVAVHELKPVAMFPVDGADPPSYTFDFGQEIEGWTRLVLPPGVPAGTNVTIAHAEALSHPPLTTPTGEAVQYDGSAFMGNLFWADPIDHYVASGRGTGETYEPSFTSHGFRVAQVTAVPPFPTPPTEAMLTAVNLRTAVAEAASVVIANPLLQQISNNSWWTEAAALFGVPSGAAGRGERAAWTGDAAFASESELFDFDSAALFVSYLAQIRDIQCDDGTIGNVVPSTDPRRDGDLPGGPNCTNLEKDPSWGTVYPTVAHNMLKYYDARDVVQSHWPRLTLYLQMLERQHNTTGLKHFFCTFGDW